jgi:hypothetical protein
LDARSVCLSPSARSSSCSSRSAGGARTLSPFSLVQRRPRRLAQAVALAA